MGRRRSSSPFSLFSFQDIITSVTGIIILLTLILALELLTRKQRAAADPTTVAQHSETAQELEQQIRAAEQQAASLESQLQNDQKVLEELAGATPESMAQRKRDAAAEIRRLEAEMADLSRELADKRDAEKQADSQAGDDAKVAERVKQLEAKRDAAEGKLKDLVAKNRLIYNSSPGTQKSPWLVEIDGDKLLVAKAGAAAESRVFNQRTSSARIKAFREFAKARDTASEYFVLLVKPSGLSTFEALRPQLERLDFEIGFDLIGNEQTAIEVGEGAAPQ